MNRRILFSPVGGTDPIPMTNFHDGSLLHICRVYRPDEVILYMSQEMLEKQEKDDRYRRALQMLFDKQGRKEVVVREIQRPELKRVEEFDFFYDEFQHILTDIFAEMDESDELLLNVSSGTPAMKSGILITQNFMGSTATVIQVPTPTGGMNEHRHDNTHDKKDTYDLEELWELNPDNEEHFVNRCVEVKSASFTRMKNEETIKRLVESYDYQAAITVAREMPKNVTAPYLDIIQMANYRTLLDEHNVERLISKTGYNCYPVGHGINRTLFEYTLNGFLKLDRKLYSDYILSITPITVNLFELILKKQVGFCLDDYISERNPGAKEWSEDKLMGTKYEQILMQHFGNRVFNYGYVNSETLSSLIFSLCEDENLKRQCRKLRDIEKKIRNIVAHQIVKIDESVIKQQTDGETVNAIMGLIKSLIQYTDINATEEYWDSYRKMNEEIFRRMSTGKKD